MKNQNNKSEYGYQPNKSGRGFQPSYPKNGNSHPEPPKHTPHGGSAIQQQDD